MNPDNNIGRKNCSVVVMSGSEDGHVFDIAKDQMTIGRGENNDIPIVEDVLMRAMHATLYIKDSRYFLVSESSSDKQSPLTVEIFPDRIFTLGETEFVLKTK